MLIFWLGSCDHFVMIELYLICYRKVSNWTCGRTNPDAKPGPSQGRHGSFLLHHPPDDLWHPPRGDSRRHLPAPHHPLPAPAPAPHHIQLPSEHVAVGPSRHNFISARHAGDDVHRAAAAGARQKTSGRNQRRDRRAGEHGEQTCEDWTTRWLKRVATNQIQCTIYYPLCGSNPVISQQKEADL